MKKRLATIFLAVVMLFSLYVPVAAEGTVAALTGKYQNSEVTITGTLSEDYMMVRIVDTENENAIIAADSKGPGGDINIQIKTGVLETKNNRYKIWINGETSLLGEGWVVFDEVAKTYTITFNANGGTISSGSATMTTGTDGKLVSLPSATRSGYTFDGWYTASSGGTKISTSTVFTSDTTVYAQWTSNGGGGNQGGGGSSGGGGGGGSSVSKKVSVNSTKNGSVSISPSYPSKGNKVTLTAKPNSGYVLDSIKVLDSKGNEVELTKVDDNKYTFIMPDGKVTVDAKFVKADGSSSASFSDVSDTHWAIKEITWAAENGIMNGIGGGQFAPDRTVTRQQLWMVMARLGGSNPADMAAARSWAMSNNISDGTRPGEALTRQQLVAILYRYAKLIGYPTDGATEITTFPDHATVSNYAKDAMAWAVGNGIVAGTSDGRLNPGGTATRAQFAVIMYRFDQKFAN